MVGGEGSDSVEGAHHVSGGSSPVGSSRGVVGTSIVGHGGGSVVRSIGHSGGSSMMSHSHGGSVSDSNGSDSNLSDDGSRVHGVSRLGHHSVEAVVGISGVVDGAGGAIGLDQAVLSLDEISVTDLALALVVSGVGVVDSIVEGVLGVGLQCTQIRCKH